MDLPDKDPDPDTLKWLGYPIRLMPSYIVTRVFYTPGQFTSFNFTMRQLLLLGQFLSEMS